MRTVIERYRNNSISSLTLINYFLLILIGLIMFYPFWYILMYSLSTYSEVIHKNFLILPVGFTMDNMLYVLKNASMYVGVINSAFVTIVGTILSVIITLMIAYPMSKRIHGINTISFFVYFTMLFSGGMIPIYLIVKDTGLMNSLWSLIIPQLVNPFNLYILRNFIKGIPESMVEAATIDGAGHMTVLTRIIIPLALPIIATIALFYGARYWNAFFDAVIYISDPKKWTIQLVIRDLIMQQNPEVSGGSTVTTGKMATANTLETVKMALVVFSVLPMVAVYPFLQKYFVKGVMVGAVKS
ncbi:MAG TPA: carbohydrate ABC transporter permease [Ruminiclostridium sp.]